MKTVFERSVFLPDLHVPHHDEKAFDCALGFVKKFKPEFVFIIGDWVDFYQLSKFDKNPARIPELQMDIDKTIECLRRLRACAPKAKIYYLKGNHENRLNRYLWSAAASLSSLRSIAVPELLQLKDLGIEYVETGSMMFHGFLVKHGNVVRTRSGYSATGELEKAGISGISGHTHRLSHIFKRHYGGMYSWTEIGCLCQLNPEYMEGQIPDWQQGLAFGYFKKGDQNFTVHVAPIIKGRLIYNGEFV